MDKKIKIAIIGLGHIGKIHIEALLSNSNYELVAVCDRNTSYKRFIDEADFFESYEEMLDIGGFEVVVVATPNNTHSVIAKDILLKGYNVILEKPAVNTLDEFDTLEKTAFQSKKHIYYAFHAACASEVLWFRDYYERNKKEFGALKGFSCSFFDPYFDENSLIDYARGLDNPWLDSGVNALSVVNAFLEVDNLTVSSKKVSTKKLQNISTVVKFDIIDGILGIIDTAWDQGRNFKSTELYFENNKKVVLNHTTQQAMLIIPSDKKVMKEFQGERLLNHYINIFSDYHASLQENKFNSKQSLQIHKKLFEVGVE